MRCPFCAAEGSQVKDSRASEDDTAIRRRRACGECGGRFTTFERVQLRELTVLKKSGRSVPFNREKLEKSLSLALRKRDVDEAKVARMVSSIIRQLEASGETEIPVDTIGAMALDALKDVDLIAYMRFASVYRDFNEAGDFRSLLDELEADGEK
ncbi:transcriptional regulator NrdR [Ahrensia sp. R2A130]|uniref:transcriptional regulator NrdR n=1 Tax=Ahrensia sp. R2A130 TaxID=744979 RepID=UPI0001E08C03|nr:transcriptional regulator NrdR [Ahrensia sp. R2A130]EFL90530.1 transcriptional regulator NrdR [Ahrensia sp. R2A130]